MIVPANNQKAKDLIIKAEKYRKGSKIPWISGDRVDEAADMFIRAANLLKISKNCT
jgi:hypothetical protein